MIIDKCLILSEIKSYYKLKTDADFARFLGIKPQTLSSWYTRNVFDIELLYAKCVDIDANWLLTGRGEMLRNGKKIGDISNSTVVGANIGSGNTIQHTISSEAIAESSKNYQEIIKKQQEQMDKLIEIINKLSSK